MVRESRSGKKYDEFGRPIKKSRFAFWKRSHIKKTENRDSKLEERGYEFRNSPNKEISDSKLSELDTKVKSYEKSAERLSLEFDEIDSMMKPKNMKGNDKTSSSYDLNKTKRGISIEEISINKGVNVITFVQLIIFVPLLLLAGFLYDITFLFIGIILLIVLLFAKKPEE